MYVSLWHICEDQLDKSHISGLYCRVNVEWGDYLTTKNQKRQTKSELISSLENDETSLVVSWTILDLDVHITLSLAATPVFRAPKGVLHIPMVTLKAWYLLGILQDLQLKTYPNILSRNLLNRICCDNHQKMGFTTQTSLATCNNCSHPLATERQVCTRSRPGTQKPKGRDNQKVCNEATLQWDHHNIAIHKIHQPFNKNGSLFQKEHFCDLLIMLQASRSKSS